MGLGRLVDVLFCEGDALTLATCGHVLLFLAVAFLGIPLMFATAIAYDRREAARERRKREQRRA